MTEAKPPPEAPTGKNIIEWVSEIVSRAFLQKLLGSVFGKVNGAPTEKVVDAAPVQPMGTTKEPSLMNIEVTDGIVKIGKEFSVPVTRLREVRFMRKDRDNFSVIAQVFNEKSSSFTPYRGQSNTVVAVVKADNVPGLETKLGHMGIRTLYLSA